MTDIYVPFPPNQSLTPAPKAKWLGKKKVSMRLPLIVSPEWRAYYALMLLFGLACLATVILSTVFQSLGLEDTIEDQNAILERAVQLISHTNLTINTEDTCALSQGVFVLDSANPHVAIVPNNATYVPPSVTMFNLSSLNWEIPKGSLTTSSNFTFYHGGAYHLCCDFNASRFENRCTCVWPQNAQGAEAEKCGGLDVFSLGSEYCQLNLLNNQVLGVNQIRNPYDEFAPASNVTALDLNYDQVYIDHALQYGNGTQQAPQAPDEIVVASNHSGGLFSFADVSGCPFSDCSAYPDRFGYEFNVFSIIYPIPNTITSQSIQDAQTGCALGNQYQCDPDTPLAQKQCVDSTIFPLSPDPYVDPTVFPQQNTSNPQDYFANQIATTVLGCGMENGIAPYQCDRIFPCTVTPASLFSTNPQYVSSPFFPIRTSATYKVEFGCTIINEYLTTDDDEAPYPDTTNFPEGQYDMTSPNAKYHWCTHFYDGLADDDACNVYDSTPNPHNGTSSLPCCDLRDTAACLDVFFTQWQGPLSPIPATIGGDCGNGYQGCGACDTCKDYNHIQCQASCDSKSNDNPQCDGNDCTDTDVCICKGCPGNSGNTCSAPSDQNFWSLAKKRQVVWDAVAMQLYTVCVGVDPNNYNSADGLATNMFFSIQRVNPMVWGTGSSGMTFELEGHAYWTVNNTAMELHPGFVGQCGVFSAATPWMFNSQQEVVKPTIQMNGVPGFEDVPYPGQAQANNPSMNHMCNTNSAVASNCYIRVNSFLPGKPQVVSATSKREAKVWEPETGKLYWKGRLGDMPKAEIWETEFKDPKKRENMQENVFEMLKRAEADEKLRRQNEMQRQHAANVKAIVDAARHPSRKKRKTL